MSKKKINIFLPLCIIFSILYIFLAIKPLSKELHYSSKWTIDCSKSTTNQDTEKSEFIPFRLGQTAGYFTENGEILNTVTFPYKITISDNRYAYYGNNDKEISFYTPTGSKEGVIKQQGFPFFQKNKLYIMKPGGSAFSELNEDGSEKWGYENYAPITAFSSSKSGTVSGYADGTIIAFDNVGNKVQEYAPGGSDYPVILGIAISESGNYIASVSGQDRQRFVLAKNTNKLTTILFHDFFKTSTTRQTYIKFSNDEKFVYYSHESCLGVLNCETLKNTHIPINGHIISIQQSETSDIVFVLSKENDYYIVSIIEPHDNYAGSFKYKANHSFIKAKGNSLFIGRDNKISMINVEYK